MPGRYDYPDVSAIRQLPKLAGEVIPAKWEDQNGHVNVTFYMATYSSAGWRLFEPMGIDDSYFSERQTGFVDLENHFRYLSELHIGDRISVYGRFLDHDSKRVRGMLLVVNDETDVLACTIEFLSIAMDLEKRRATEIPRDIATRLAEVTSEHQRLAWTVPTRLSRPG
jgi:acyl-CoA thioester hydrolase